MSVVPDSQGELGLKKDGPGGLGRGGGRRRLLGGCFGRGHGVGPAPASSLILLLLLFLLLQALPDQSLARLEALRVPPHFVAAQVDGEHLTPEANEEICEQDWRLVAIS